MEVSGELEILADLAPPYSTAGCVCPRAILDNFEETKPSKCQELHPDIALM
jgi:hypothetical protein